MTTNVCHRGMQEEVSESYNQLQELGSTETCEDIDAIKEGYVADEKADKQHVQITSEEKQLIQKLDLWIIPLMMVTYFLQSYDKGIMSSATQFGFNEDLGLTIVLGYEANGTPITNNTTYANASMIFYIGYLVGTYPMMYLCQRFPTGKVVSAATFFWGIVVMTTATCDNYAAIMLCRFFLGVLESAIAPAFTVIVTFWWTRDEQALRNGMWYGCVGIATTVSPLINYALGQIHGTVGSWKAIFLVLGAVTFGWSFVLFVFLPNSPLTTKYLSDGERRIALARLERNKTGTISSKFNKTQFFEALWDYKTYSCALIVLLTGIPSGALGTFSTIVVHDFGFNSFDSLALTCPIGAITAISVFFVGYITRKLHNSRYLLMNICALISIAGTLICWLGPRSNKGLLFAGIFLLALQVATGSLAVSIVSSNVAGRTKKSTVSAAVFVGYCIGNVIGPLIFGASPGPRYYAGFLGSFISLVAVLVVVTSTFTLLYHENKRRDNLYVHLEGSQFVGEDLTDKENKDFRYVL